MLFCERLKMLREKKNLTQREVAAYLKTTPSNYQKYEYGKIEPSLQSIDKLCRLFNVSADYLLGFTDEQKDTRNYMVPGGIVLDGYFADITKAICQINSEDVSQAIDSLLFLFRHLLEESASTQIYYTNGHISGDGLMPYIKARDERFTKSLKSKLSYLYKCLNKAVFPGFRLSDINSDDSQRIV